MPPVRYTRTVQLQSVSALRLIHLPPGVDEQRSNTVEDESLAREIAYDLRSKGAVSEAHVLEIGSDTRFSFAGVLAVIRRALLLIALGVSLWVVYRCLFATRIEALAIKQSGVCMICGYIIGTTAIDICPECGGIQSTHQGSRQHLEKVSGLGKRE
jgi:hypothetical protein